MQFLLFLFLITALPSSSSPLEFEKADVIQEIQYDTTPAPQPLSFSEEKIDSYKKDPEFDYSEEQSPINWWTKFKRYVKMQYHSFLEWLFGDYTAGGFLSFVIKSLPYLIIGVVLYLAVWLFIKINPGAILLRESPPGRVLLSEEEEIINSKDISSLIKTALEQKKYRLAIRYRYLLTLRELSEQGIIFYEFSKTDQDYAAEIKEKPLKVQFLKLAKIYDFVWYGNFEPKEEHYQKSEKEFDRIQELIQKGNEQKL